MWINSLFSTNPLSYIVEVRCWVYHRPQLATCGPLIHLALFKWPQIWHKVHNNHTSNDVLISSSPGLPLFCFEISKKFIQRLKFTVPIVVKQNPFYHHARKAHDGVMVQVWPQNTIWSSNLRVSHTLFNRLWSTVVWPNLPKFITN